GRCGSVRGRSRGLQAHGAGLHHPARLAGGRTEEHVVAAGPASARCLLLLLTRPRRLTQRRTVRVIPREGRPHVAARRGVRPNGRGAPPAVVRRLARRARARGPRTDGGGREALAKPQVNDPSRWRKGKQMSASPANSRQASGRSARSRLSQIAIGALALAALGMASAQSITIAISEGIQGFDPAGNNRTVASTVYPNIFDALVHKDAAGNMVPGLATSWEPVDADSWRIVLREGVTWHDGQPFTAADVEFTLERIASTTELARNVLFAHVTDVEVVNDHEVVIHTETPDPLMPGNLAANGAQIVPKHYYESAGVDAATVSPIGTGPYKFVEYRPDDRLVVEANADYWGGVPVYQQATFRVIGENTTSVSELITGGVQITGVDATDRQRVEDNASTRLIIQPTNRV